MPTHYDIVIVGAGPVGLMLSSCLSRWGYRIKHIDNRAEPTETGRADGIQPRSLDLLRNMGLKSAIMAHKPARVYEVAFWDPVGPCAHSNNSDDTKHKRGIARTGTWASCPDFIDARYPFTTLLHQGYIERVFLGDMAKNGTTVQRPWTIGDFNTSNTSKAGYPVEVKLRHVDGADKGEETVQAKYLFSGEGARSSIREKLGIKIRHIDPISYVWGVMDGVVKTDFPDIKPIINSILQMKCTIHSEHGSIMVIPREDDMVRLYIQIASSTDPDFNPRKSTSARQVQASAQKIFQPYSIEWERLEWYSVYPIGQGISDKYTLDNRVFLGGDACHTHSPKAGQGMNTAFLDALNLAWKLHHVESGFASRTILDTYESERRGIAETLLNFDNRYARLFSQKPSAATIEAATEGQDATLGTADKFVQTFKEACEFTSGYGVAYHGNIFNWSPSHPVQSPLIIASSPSSRLCPGRLFPNATVTRVIDANVVHLEQEVPLNGAFRVFIFAGDASNAANRNALFDFGRALEAQTSFLSLYRHSSNVNVSYREMDTPHSRFFTFCTIFATKRAQISVTSDVPEILARYRSHVYADDRNGNSNARGGLTAHEKMGLTNSEGGVIVVRPDGYVGVFVKLVEGTGTVNVLNEYFGAFCTKVPATKALTSHL
ncbi:hypothetical protein Cpir12675_002715 [Ceratocystis pirilliformis]|uniref:Phenol 2-monooxygenase n=1 Tax=Ceratocystis pirilliformis TaxID=259994 RepID=A0ABR3Z7Q1_9PEZI